MDRPDLEHIVLENKNWSKMRGRAIIPPFTRIPTPLVSGHAYLLLLNVHANIGQSKNDTTPKSVSFLASSPYQTQTPSFLLIPCHFTPIPNP
jgi:hypothetical protein